jgi:hypothetical protein
VNLRSARTRLWCRWIEADKLKVKIKGDGDGDRDEEGEVGGGIKEREKKMVFSDILPRQMAFLAVQNGLEREGEG